MTRRLDSLSKEQRALIPVVRDEWLDVGLATGAADRDAAWQGARASFEAAGLQPPGVQVWLRSPLEGVIGVHMLGQVRDQVRGQVRDQVWGQVGDLVRGQVRGLVWGQVRDQVWDQVGGQVRGQVWGQVGGQVGDQVGELVGELARGQVQGQVWDQVRGQVGGQVWDQVGGQVRGQVWGQVRDQAPDQVGGQVWGQVRHAVFGQHDASWLSFYDFFGRCGVDGPERLRGLSTVARSAGWWWPFSGPAGGLVVFTERPIELHRDDEGRLHHESRPAALYPDGFGIWAWHGVRVPSQVIEAPGSLAADAVMKEQNVEVRRVMMERYGHDRLLRDAGATLLDESEWGKLWRLEVEDDEPLVMVECVNSTAEPDGSYKDYFLRVAPACGTAREALGWTFGYGEQHDYAPVVET